MKDECATYHEKIAELLAGELPASDATDVERHIAGCTVCRRFHQDLVGDDRLLTDFVRSVDDEVARLEGLVMTTIASAAATEPVAVKSVSWPARLFASRWMKVAAAAAVIFFVVVGVNLLERDEPQNIVWADVLAKVEDARGFICRSRQVLSNGRDIEMVQYLSAEYGLKVDIYHRGRLAAVQYIRPDEKMMYSIMHRDRTYMLMKLTDEQLTELETMSDAQELVKRFKESGFEELGRRRVDGVEASGIEVKNPIDNIGDFDRSVVRMWVDVETGWPVRIEMEGEADEGELRAEMVMDDFQWNPSFSSKDFEFEIPDDYRSIGELGAVQKDEASAIEGLRQYARLLGRYPNSLAAATVMHQADRALESRDGGESISRDRLEDFMKILDACAFHVELVKQEKDVAYYGDRVGPRDFDEVLMRWRLEDGRYRVLYGDLRTEDVDPERLSELEDGD